jgi:SAM-dependent methyltransferase
MVERARARVASPGVVLQGDAFALPFGAGAFGGVAALRFAFHWPDLAPLLDEMRRVAAPGAPLVFDTYVWSPRALLAFGAARWGGRVFLHRPRAVRQLAARHGLAVEAEEHAFLWSPYVYRLLPLAAVRALERIERVVPSAWLCRIFWRLRSL